MPKTTAERAAFLIALPRAQRRKLLALLSDPQRRALRHHWQLWAHEGQLPPEGEWTVWLILAGRGFGKTRAGAEWVRAIAEADPAARIALVGASLGEARSVMVEGESGLLAIAPHGKRPRFEPSRRLLTWPTGAQAVLYSAGEPESLRGPQHSHACRSGAEGGLRQRGFGANRRAASRCHRERTRGSAGIAPRRPVLACRHRGERGMGRKGRPDRGTPGRPVVVLRPG
jgi:hypothetical protein